MDGRFIITSYFQTDHFAQEQVLRRKEKPWTLEQFMEFCDINGLKVTKTYYGSYYATYRDGVSYFTTWEFIPA